MRCPIRLDSSSRAGSCLVCRTAFKRIARLSAVSWCDLLLEEDGSESDDEPEPRRLCWLEEEVSEGLLMSEDVVRLSVKDLSK